MTPVSKFGKMSAHQKSMLRILGNLSETPGETEWKPLIECSPKPMLRQNLHMSAIRLVERGFIEKRTKGNMTLIRLTEKGHKAFRWVMAMETIRELEKD